MPPYTIRYPYSLILVTEHELAYLVQQKAPTAQYQQNCELVDNNASNKSKRGLKGNSTVFESFAIIMFFRLQYEHQVLS